MGSHRGPVSRPASLAPPLLAPELPPLPDAPAPPAPLLPPVSAPLAPLLPPVAPVPEPPAPPLLAVPPLEPVPASWPPVEGMAPSAQVSVSEQVEEVAPQADPRTPEPTATKVNQPTILMARSPLTLVEDEPDSLCRRGSYNPVRGADQTA